MRRMNGTLADYAFEESACILAALFENYVKETLRKCIVCV